MLTWHPGVDWSTAQVFGCHAAHDLPLHEAYTAYGSSRLSCAYCVLAAVADLRAAASAAGNLDLYRHLVAMEATSTFSCQPGRWLADVAPRLLSTALTTDVARAKIAAAERRHLEQQLELRRLISRYEI